jgi:hypothetical protein
LQSAFKKLNAYIFLKHRLLKVAGKNFPEVVSKPSIGFKVFRPRPAGQERGDGEANRPD